MGNFDFLLEDKDYSDFADACIQAERAMMLNPTMSALLTRRALELAVKWVYKFDQYLKIPYQDNLASLVNNYDFADLIGSQLKKVLWYTIKLGNIAAHTTTEIERSKAMLSLRCLFQFVDWIDETYGIDYKKHLFYEKLVPDSEVVMQFTLSKKEKILEENSAKLDKPIVEMRTEVPDEKVQVMEKAHHDAQLNDYQVDKMLEKDVRRDLIDLDLLSSGWIKGQNMDIEVPINNLITTPTGQGAIDYVLYGKNGKPLAIVEAKRPDVGEEMGRYQADDYAKAISDKYHQEVYIYRTNGYKLTFIEPGYPERQVFGFHTQDELQMKIDRQLQQTDWDEIELNTDIAGRRYQMLAIKHILESFKNHRREALLVMATGSGKTRTAVSLVDALTRANRVKNILFLADRTALVKQAYRSFNALLPNLTSCNLMEAKHDKQNDPETSRIVFSTYQTILNSIDNLKTRDDKLLFTPGHFDLIIVDEAHRSIYQKYGDIFKYFDSFLVGLTATPRDEVDRNTYYLFNLEEGNPTYAYELKNAVDEGFLVSYHTVETKLKLPTRGIHYDELSVEEQEEFENNFGDDISEVSGSEINKHLFNAETIDKVLKQVMDLGIRDSSGDEIGKTIIFAQNHRHAEVIKERFEKLFPQKGSHYAEVIDNHIKYSQDLIDQFSNKDTMPQIAISVDMMDTGIDVPEVVNLVFFKAIKSRVKFWQMIGRGTRKCPNLFGEGQDKKEFLVFDYGENMEFFRADKQIVEPKLPKSLTERLFNKKVELIYHLQGESEVQLKEYRQKWIDECVQKINQLDESQFQVKMRLKEVQQYKKPDNWLILSEKSIQDLKMIAPLIVKDNELELTRRFDLLMFSIEVAILGNGRATAQVNQVSSTAGQLLNLTNIEQVKVQEKLLKKVMKPSFFDNISITELENIRQSLRELVKLIPKQEQAFYYTNFSDEIMEVKEGEALYQSGNLQPYQQRVEGYLKDHEDYPAIYKIRHNEDLTSQDLEELETVLWKELGTKEEYEKDNKGKSLVKFVREIVGMSPDSVNAAFSEFINQPLNEAQLHFVNHVVKYITKNGYLDKKELIGGAFKQHGSLTALFTDKGQVQLLIQIIDGINEKANV